MTTNTASAPVHAKGFGAPDKVTRALGELAQAEIIELGDTTAVRATFQPSFR